MRSTKVDIFLQALAEQVAKDSDMLKTSKRMRKGFRRAVTSLEDGELKNELLVDMDECFIYLQKIIREQVQDTKTNAQTEEIENRKTFSEMNQNEKLCPSPPFLYNLYCKTGLNLDEESLGKLDESSQKDVYRTYLRCALPKLDTKALFDIAARCQTVDEGGVLSLSGPLMELCTCLHGDTDVDSLKVIMKIFNEKYAEAAEFTTKRKWLLQLVAYGTQFLKMFHFHYQALKQEFKVRPKYEDYVAGILATHLDCHLQLFHSDPSCCPVSGKQLCSFVIYLLHKQPDFAYDVLLQLEKVQSGDGSLILPLARYLLENVMPRDNCALYVKFALAVRFVTRWIPEGTDDMKQKALNVPAPSDFLEWIENIDSKHLDQFPETKHFIGAKVTKYILDEADDDVVKELFDLLTDSYSVDSAADKIHTAETAEDGGPVTDNRDLFVIDKAPDSTTVSEMKDVFNLQADEAAEQSLNEQDSDVGGEGAIADNEEFVNEQDGQDGTVQFEILTREEALKMNLIERTETVLERLFDVSRCERKNEKTEIILNGAPCDVEVVELQDDSGGTECRPDEEECITRSGDRTEGGNDRGALDGIISDGAHQQPEPDHQPLHASRVVAEEGGSVEGRNDSGCEKTSETGTADVKGREKLDSTTESSARSDDDVGVGCRSPRKRKVDKHSEGHLGHTQDDAEASYEKEKEAPSSASKRKSLQSRSDAEASGEKEMEAPSSPSKRKSLQSLSDNGMGVMWLSPRKRKVDKHSEGHSQDNAEASGEKEMEAPSSPSKRKSLQSLSDGSSTSEKSPKMIPEESVKLEADGQQQKLLTAAEIVPVSPSRAAVMSNEKVGWKTPSPKKCKTKTKLFPEDGSGSSGQLTPLLVSPKRDLANKSPSPRKVSTPPCSRVAETLFSDNEEVPERRRARRKAASPKTDVTAKHQDVARENVRQRSSPSKKDAVCDGVEKVPEERDFSEKEKPVSRRLRELRVDIGTPAKQPKLTAADMAQSLKAAITEEVGTRSEGYSGRRHSTSTSVNQESENESSVVGRTPRRAAAKARERLAMFSPRKRRDSLASLRSTESRDDDDEAVTKSGKSTDVSNSAESEQLKEASENISSSLIRNKAKHAITSRRCSMSAVRNSKSSDNDERKGAVKDSPKNPSASKRRYSLRAHNRKSQDVD